MENYNHNCLVFATHKLDEGILDYLAYLKKEVNSYKHNYSRNS